MVGALALVGLAASQGGAAPSSKRAVAKPLSAPPPQPAGKPAPIRGYVLTHWHPTQGMAFGGNYAFAGGPGNYRNGIMVKGYKAACGGCKMLSGCDHGEVKGSFMGSEMGSDMGDHDAHKGPRHDAFSHLRYATDWIKEAFDPTEAEFKDARMRIMVAFAVENEALCEQLYYVNKGKGGPGGDGYPCSKGDSLESLERQLDSIKAWAKENSSWVEIAYSAADARRIANAGKLVVILGVEAEYAFGAEDRTFDPVSRLQRYYDKGVRTFYLAHKINSRLAGADIYHPKDAGSGEAIRAIQAISGCFYYDDNIGAFPLKTESGKHNFCANNCGKNYFKGEKITDACASKFSEISEVNMVAYIRAGASTFNGFKVYPLPPGFKSHAGKGGSRMEGTIERNNLGLSHDGERVVREAMLKGMIVNIDHISSVARKNIYDIATKDFGGYPLNALHNNPNAMLVGKMGTKKVMGLVKVKLLETPYPHEFDFDDVELDYIRKTGGFFGVRLGPLDAKEYPASGVTRNCPKTSTETAKILAYLLDKGLPVGYALDFASVTEGVHSRTFEGCPLDGTTDYLHKYGSEIAEGISHIGMMKKWHKELEAVKLKKTYLDKLKNDGAEAFIAMWERAEAKSKLGKQIPRQTFATSPREDTGCTRDSDCASGQYCADPIAGKRSCKALKARGQTCTAASQCSTGRCSWGVCADADECRSNADCSSSQYCGDPISGKRSCKALKSHGQACTSATQCSTGRCSWGFCADADECRSDADCSASQYCGDPIGGKATCKDLLGKGKACTKGRQCKSGKCSWFTCD